MPVSESDIDVSFLRGALNCTYIYISEVHIGSVLVSESDVNSSFGKFSRCTRTAR